MELRFLSKSSRSIMAGLENMWSHFTLDDEEEYGAEVPKPVEAPVHQLAG